eukprot:1785628-Amphidinium_carterae.1
MLSREELLAKLAAARGEADPPKPIEREHGREHYQKEKPRKAIERLGELLVSRAVSCNAGVELAEK